MPLKVIGMLTFASAGLSVKCGVIWLRPLLKTNPTRCSKSKLAGMLTGTFPQQQPQSC